MDNQYVVLGEYCFLISSQVPIILNRVKFKIRVRSQQIPGINKIQVLDKCQIFEKGQL